MAFNLDDYESVADRIDRFWKDHVEGRITTELVHHDDKRYIVKAYIFRDIAGAFLEPDATGYAEETIGSTNVNKTSALENCETSAIGRALANLGYASKGQRASREEMAKAQPEPRPRSGGQKRTPSPEKPPAAPQADLSPDVAVEVKRMKNWAFQQLGKDADKTKEIWGKVISTYEMNGEGMPNAASLQFIESDLSIAVGEALTATLVET